MVKTSVEMKMKLLDKSKMFNLSVGEYLCVIFNNSVYNNFIKYLLQLFRLIMIDCSETLIFTFFLISQKTFGKNFETSELS